jgi:glycerophosphoryl diester phosphodiesterase
LRADIPRLFAHRGCSGTAPENTLAAFKAALDHGIPGIELDVHLARSGEVIVIHDANLKRVAGVDVRVGEIDLPELKTVDVGAMFDSKFAGERVPLLDEVFELLDGRMVIDIELKAERGEERRLAAAVVDRIVASGMQANCLVSSFNPIAIRWFSRLNREVPTALIYSNHPGVPALLRGGAGCLLARCDFVKPHWQQTGRLSLARHRSDGRSVSPLLAIGSSDVALRHGP